MGKGALRPEVPTLAIMVDTITNLALSANVTARTVRKGPTLLMLKALPNLDKSSLSMLVVVLCVKCEK